MKKRFLGLFLALTLILSSIVIAPTSASAATGFTDAKGWFESAYAEWSAIAGADGYNAYVASVGSSDWNKIDDELVRYTSGTYRVDAVGLTAGDYQIKVIPTAGGEEQEEKAMLSGPLKVLEYDRSGFAHFNYTDGVGAYNDDGTLKDNAIVIYVTDENKNTVSVTSKDGTTVTGIGNILGSTGMDVGGGLNSKGGKANTNSDILRKLAADGTPLVVRIIGNVKGADSTNLSSATSQIDGLTQYNGVDYGGSVGDNGFMVRMSGGKNITIEGIGDDAAIDGWGLHFICQTADYAAGYGRSFEVRNLAFVNVPEDCVGMEGQQEGSTLTAPVERCWIHHCSFYAPSISSPAESDKDGGDGACDFKRGQYFTNSYCNYNGYHKTNLVGSSDSSLQFHLTYHHNYWKNCESRGPLARNANIHMYNNIFEGQTSYCMNPRANAYIFSEYNMFINSKNPVTVDSGAVKSYNDSFASCIGDNNATIVYDRATEVSTNNRYANFDTNPSISYIPSGDYEIQESITEMKRVVMAYAGTQSESIVSPEDVNISVIPENKKPGAAIALPYNKTLNKTYVSANGTVDNVVFNVAKFNADSLTVGGNANGSDIVFYVDCTVNITMTEISGSYSPVLCNETGEAFITGSGSAKMLPAGYYMIQSSGYDVGSSKFKEAKIASLTIEKAIVCTEHSYKCEVTEPTCTKGGYSTYTCSICGDIYTDNNTPARGHTPGAEANCTAPQTCTVCNSELAPITAHDYKNGKCSVCGKPDPALCEHINTISAVTAPTCTAPGYTTYTCKDCAHVFTGNEVSAKGHTPGAEATCTTAQTCTVCRVVIIAATGHSYVENICSVCGQENLAAKGYVHNFTDDGWENSFFTFAGGHITGGKHGTYTYDFGDGTKELNYALKFDSEGSISFTPDTDGTITIAAASKSSGSVITLNDTKIELIDSNKLTVVTLNVTANTSYTLKRSKNESGIYYIAYTPDSSNAGGSEDTEKNPFFTGASLMVGSDLSVRYHILPEEGKAISDYSMRFTMNEKVSVVKEGIVENGKYIFSFCGISPQCMGDSIKAELLDGDTVIDIVENFSVKQYAILAFKHFNTDEYAALRQFISDMLYYGAAAQKYVNYKTDALVTAGMAGLLGALDCDPTVDDNQKSIITANGQNTSFAKFTVAGVRFDYDNRIYVKFNTQSIENVRIVANGIELEATLDSGNVYVAYSDGISALEFGEAVSFTLIYNDEIVQTLNYSVNTYTWDKRSDAEIGELALALYRYGKSAEAYRK